MQQLWNSGTLSSSFQDLVPGFFRTTNTMPDDFDFSQPRARRSASNVDFPLLTTILVAFSVIFTASRWIAEMMPQSPLSAISALAAGSPTDIWQGHYLSLVLSIFPHADPLHIIFNLLWLWRLGMAIEAEVNPLTYVGFVVAAGVISGLSELFCSGLVGQGMSGVVYAMFGLIYAGRGHNRTWQVQATKENLKLFIGWGLLCIVLTAMNYMLVANGAHFGGLLFGYCVGRLFFAPRKNMGFAALALAQIGLCAMVTFYQPWSGHWQWYAGNKDYKAGRIVQAAAHYRMGIKILGQNTGLLKNLRNSDLLLLNNSLDKNDAKLAEFLNHELKDISQKMPEGPEEKEPSEDSAKSGKEENVPQTKDADGKQNSKTGKDGNNSDN